MTEELYQETKERMEKSISHYQSEVSTIRSGRASTTLLDTITVEFYGTSYPLKNIALLRATKNKKYPFYRLDTHFSDIKHQSVNIVSDGGWHFSNLKNVEELERKFLNDENHSEYEIQGHNIDRIKKNIKNRSIDYNHHAKQDSSDRFSPTKLQFTDIDILHTYLLNIPC